MKARLPSLAITPILWLDYYHCYWTSEDAAGLARTLRLDGQMVVGHDARSYGDRWRYRVTKRKGHYVVTHVLVSYRWGGQTLRIRS